MEMKAWRQSTELQSHISQVLLVFYKDCYNQLFIL